ncbi:MAG TPA: membrane or secreted protein [Chryseosolibacter sp.]|nr:membrane or secreted protein [Chryseosolibacter sp.]
MRRLLCFLIILVISFPVLAQKTALTGAWQCQTDSGRVVMICSEKFFAAAVYDDKTKTFTGTCGGAYRVEGNSFVEVHEFNTLKPDMIGREIRTPIEIKKSRILFTESAGKREWTRIDDGTPGVLAGAWLITGRMEKEAMNTITPGARRTIKILSGTRFQWIAYNVETKEFFGTGGGTYTTKDGKYAEAIEFFSRDNSRVGKTLEFDFSLDSGNWRHKGLSSKGDPIDEVWTKREKLKI